MFQEVEFENVKEVENEEGVQDEAKGIPPIDPMLAQQSMSFLKRLAGRWMIPPTQVPANPLVATLNPRQLERQVMMLSCVLCWDL